MSGFQIPGLGQAQPNETLPPLHADVAAASNSAGDDADMKDAAPQETSEPPAKIEEGASEAKTEELPAAAEPQDTMIIDQPESPPSLTHALEAAIGGLDSAPTEQPQPPTQPEPEAQPQLQAPVQPQEQEQQPAQEVALQNDQSANPEWEMDSSPYESSSESSSDSSSDDDSENEGYELLGVEETARLLMEAEGGSDDEGNGGKSASAVRVQTKNEVAEEDIPRPDITITPEMKVEELGAVEHVVDNIILVKANTTGEYQVLDNGSVLCNAERVVIGAVGETIGKVLQPRYTVRFNSADEVKELGLEVGTKIFYPVDHATYVFTEPLKGLKGSDASNLHDEEVGDEEMEFSDDEKEAEYKRSIKQKKKDKWKAGGGGRGGKDPHPLRQEMQPDGGLNYDDNDEDGPYKPLARPPGYGSGPVSTETYEPPRSFQRGGRRGDSRGRGRGRGGRGRGGYGQPSRDGYALPPQGQHSLPPQPPAPTGQWNPNAHNPQGTTPPMPNFGFQMPGWPQQPPGSAAPPPPPGWPGSQQPGQGQQPNLGSFVNPAFFAALMGQMQQGQGGQSPFGGQQQPPPPPPGGQGQ